MNLEYPMRSAESTHIRSMLRVLRAIAAHMSADRREPNASSMHLAGRIGALGRAASVPVSLGVDLDFLVRDELSVHCVHRAGITITGPEVRLNSQAAPLLSLTVHELATNAVKFGALSQPHARLGVSWWLEGAGDAAQLHFEWSEDGVHMPVSERAAGFGAELLQCVIRNELRGSGKMLFLSSGVRCTIAIPTSEALHLS